MNKKGDVIEIDITDFSTDGEGIGKTDAFTWFIKDSVIGDRVRAVVMKTKKSYGYARVVEILKESKDRVELRCPVARPCGGCALQSVSYRAQLAFKQNKVINNLIRLGGFSREVLEEVEIAPIIGMKEPWHYRNKAQYPIGTDREGNLIAGFYAGRTHSIIPWTNCLLGQKKNQIILETILDFMREHHISAYDETTSKGLVRHVLIREGKDQGQDQVMVCIIINGKSLPKSNILIERLKSIEGMISISLNINTQNTNVIMGREILQLFGPLTITDSIGDIAFEISPLSFYQVNPLQTKVLYDKALEFANLTGKETVWDLYCGIGTISLFLARKAKQVYGVEIVEAAILDAKNNAKKNHITNADFFVGKAEEVLPAMYQNALKNGNHQQSHPDVIVVDPPRKGCDRACLETMVAMQPERMVYVSCDSATLARDLKYLTANGYQLKKVQAVDQFPHTSHVETVALLSKLDSKKYISVELSMDDMDLTSVESKATYK